MQANNISISLFYEAVNSIFAWSGQPPAQRQKQRTSMTETVRPARLGAPGWRAGHRVLLTAPTQYQLVFQLLVYFSTIQNSGYQRNIQFSLFVVTSRNDKIGHVDAFEHLGQQLVGQVTQTDGNLEKLATERLGQFSAFCTMIKPLNIEKTFRMARRLENSRIL